MGTIKQISVYNGSEWQLHNIGADADKIDLTTPVAGASTVQGALNTLNTKFVEKTGGEVTGNFGYQTNADFSKTDNGITATAIYPTTSNIIDSSNRTAARIQGLIYKNGTIGSQWYIRNFDTSGNIITGNQRGITMTMDKSGNFTYSLSYPEKFVDALQFLPPLMKDPDNLVTTGTLINCSGTVSSSLYLSASTDKKLVCLQGRIRITNFVRTGTNPGVNITLPFTPIRTTGFTPGYCAEKPHEFAQFVFTVNSTAAKINVSETYSNTANGTLTFIIPNTICRIA